MSVEDCRVCAIEKIKRELKRAKSDQWTFDIDDIDLLVSTVEEQQKELSQLGEELGQWEGLELDFKEEIERLQKEIEWLKLQSLSVKEIARHSDRRHRGSYRQR
ncbi:hypothetical protein [Siminovitchia fortis]|uniref:Uncharacterized protein n=1 Tax=Siminovitchia fortis TaxID=254758 RepID=A0A443IN31_9BACI|nr:hypothetical protein [Siminovitchia fortis]RWR06736.1 hypothetical protein D4N35_013810 [Siminovitchia fortis]